jgi:predicted TIM-barrel fold metal-dependent hydrolase
MSRASNDRDTSSLLAAIQQIRAIDNHSHAMPSRRPAPVEADRPDPLGKAPFPYPVRLRVTNPEYIEAWRALYSYEHQDMADAHAREALRAKLSLMEQEGDHYPSWVLDRAGIEMMLVNTPSLGPGQVEPRFLWVPYADELLFPLDSDRQAARATGEELHHTKPPVTLDEYVSEMVVARLRKWKSAGAVAIKFGIAYRRSLDVANVPPAEAEAIYERHLHGGKPPAEEYKAVQDWLFRAAAREAGALGLAVQIHTGVGAAPYFYIGGSNPLLLESVFNDEALRQTRFVMLHGGWPFEREAGVMLIKPNVYADFSAQTFLRSTRALSQVLEEWLCWYPEKVLFGTDAYPDDTPLANWEEKVWLATRTAREALALALTRMIEAGEVDRPRAEELARMVLRENAVAFYGLGKR